VPADFELEAIATAFDEIYNEAKELDKEEKGLPSNETTAVVTCMKIDDGKFNCLGLTKLLHNTLKTVAESDSKNKNSLSNRSDKLVYQYRHAIFSGLVHGLNNWMKEIKTQSKNNTPNGLAFFYFHKPGTYEINCYGPLEEFDKLGLSYWSFNQKLEANFKMEIWEAKNKISNISLEYLSALSKSLLELHPFTLDLENVFGGQASKYVKESRKYAQEFLKEMCSLFYTLAHDFKNHLDLNVDFLNKEAETSQKNPTEIPEDLKGLISSFNNPKINRNKIRQIELNMKQIVLQIDSITPNEEEYSPSPSGE